MATTTDRLVGPARDARSLPKVVPTLLRPDIYWIDLLASSGVGALSFGLAALQPLGSMPWLLLTLVSVLAWLRALVFLHECAHRAREIPGFELAWSLLVGLPVGVPSLMYVGSHHGHHRSDCYGTSVDPEYAALRNWGWPRRLLFVMVAALAPALLVLRWGVLTPLSMIAPPLRRVAVSRCSTLAINPRFVRSAPAAGERMRWIAGEAAACGFVWGVGSAIALGLAPAALVLHWLLVIACVFAVNQLRTLLAHRYSGTGEPFDERGQLRDSLTLPDRSWLAALIAPVGLRYHALHHWAPGIPYHELGRVHRHLLAERGSREAYRETLRPSLLGALRAAAALDDLRA